MFNIVRTARQELEGTWQFYSSIK